MKVCKRSVLGVVCALHLVLGGAAPATARIAATGGFASPYFQADYIQDLTEFSAGVVNPALLYRVNQFRVEAGMYRWNFTFDILNDLGYQQISFLMPIGMRQTAGLTVLGLQGNIQNVELQEGYGAGGGLRETGGTMQYGDMWFVGHYGAKVLPWLMLGTNLKVVAQKQFEEGARKAGFGADIGIYANPLDHYRFGDVGVSLNFQDLVPAKLEWAESGSKQVMTSRLRAGLRYSALNDKIVWCGEYVLDNLLDAFWEQAFSLKDGEIANQAKDFKNNLDRVSRFGSHIRYEFIPQLWIKAGWANNNIPYVGLNVNLIYPLPEMINYAKFDFHIGYSVNEPERGLTSMFKIASDFGPTREQRMSKGLYEKLTLEPRNEYNKAMRLYMAGKYWDAAFAFGNLVSVYPNFHLNDKATFLLGNCYRYLYLNDIAREIYQEALAEYSTSEQRPNFLYGLQDLDYREGKQADALKNHAFISNLYPESEVRAEADYLAGQVHFQRKNYNAAEQLLVKVEPSAKSYIFAQYTLAVINVVNKKVKAAILNLENIVSDTTDDPSKLLLQDAANNKLGQLYFEQVDLRKAVEAFKRVPEGSVHGDEALLGTAWSWIKVNRPELCLKEVDVLISSHPESPLIPEAHLLRGYALMLLKRHNEAMSALEKCLELCRQDFADENALRSRQQQYDEYVRQFAPTGQRIKKNALRKPTDKIVAERTELRSEYDKYAQENKAYFDFTVLVEDNKKFFRQKEQILLDAEYALATATKMVGAKREEKVIDRGLEKQEKLDSEIERLQKRLENLEE